MRLNYENITEKSDAQLPLVTWQRIRGGW